MHKYILILVLIAFSSLTFGQYAENIRSGRPGLAVGPFTVGKGVIQNQSGLYSTGSETSGTNAIFQDYKEETEGDYFIAVFRGGIAEHLELGLAVSYADFMKTTTYENPDNRFETRSEGINLFSLAFRQNLFEGDGLKPAFGYQVNFSLPFVSEEFRSDYVNPRLTLLTAQFLEKFRFMTNWAGVADVESGELSGIYMLFLDRSFGKRIRVFFEHYGTIRNGLYTPRFDGGILYLLNPNLQLDVQYGDGPERNGVDDYFITAGFAWRIRFD